MENIYMVYDVCENFNPDICTGTCKGDSENCFKNMFEISDEELMKEYEEGKLK